MRAVGFFSELRPGWGFPLDGLMRDAVNTVGEPDEAAVLGYLRGGAGIWSETGAGADVLDPGGPVMAGIGSLYTDGTWLWRQDLAYYLATYHVSLPPDFLAHVREADHLVPDVPEARLMEILRRDLGIPMG